MSSPTLRRPPSIDERYVSWMPHALASSTCDIPRLSRRSRTRRPSSSAAVPVMGRQRTTESRPLAPDGSRRTCYLRPATAALSPAALATAYDPAAWHDLFVAAAGATAAPTGRNFLSGRAIEALVDLVIVLVVSLVALTPSIARGALAAVILATAAISGISPVRSLRSGGGISAPDGAPKGAAVGRLVVAAALVGFLVLAGVTLAAGRGGGLDWLPLAFVLAIVIAALNAWVLLVEILR